MVDEAAKPESTGTSVYVHPQGDQRHLMQKLDGGAGTVESNSLEYEDEFKGLYGAGTGDGRGAPGVQTLLPPVKPRTLAALVQQNNTLQQCIESMTTNVHGTGYELMLADPAATVEGQTDARIIEVQAFLDEVWPGMSFTQLRKKMSDDKEKMGNAYWEVLRNRAGKLMMLRPLEAKLTRMVILTQPSPQPVTVVRGGAKITMTVMMRYRRFVQSIGTKFVYYKEYGCPLLINKNTGELLDDNAQNRIQLLRDQAMGTEVLHFRGPEDVTTPYGVPIWYPQMPSVIGSRKAEEFNLEYFEAGGVPPLMIFVQGGTLGSGMKAALEEFLSSKPGAKQGAPVFEVQSTGGTLDNPGSGAKVTVERFDKERQKDSMFEAYDDKCEGRIRRSWRLPPIFVGKTDAHTLATAQTSYAVAEAQIFNPAREEFDELMNKTIIRELDPTGAVYLRSKGMSVKDVNQQLLAANAAFAAGALDIDHYVEVLNETVSMAMQVRPNAKADQATMFQQKLDLGATLIEVAKQRPVEAGTPPGGKKPPKATGVGSASGPSDSSEKPKVLAVKGDELAMDLARALSSRDPVALQTVTDTLHDMDLGQVLLFKHQLRTGEFLEMLAPEPVKSTAPAEAA